MKKSHLFYQSRYRRPLLDRAEGIYMWDANGKRYIDGAMVSNIGHSNPNVLAAIRRQMDKSTFGYRLHFENEPAELLAAKVSQLSPDGHDKVFFASGYIPLGAISSRQEIVDGVLEHDDFQHGFTYAGNPTACAAGLDAYERLVELACSRGPGA